MTEDLHDEDFVPAGALDLEVDGLAVGVSSQHVEGKAAENGEIVRGIVLAGTVAVLGKMDVEHPMKPVLNGPVTAGNVEQPLERDISGQQVVPHDRRIGALATQAPARGDSAHGCYAGEAFIQRRIAHDGGTSRFAAIVGRTVDRVPRRGVAKRSSPRSPAWAGQVSWRLPGS